MQANTPDPIPFPSRDNEVAFKPLPTQVFYAPDGGALEFFGDGDTFTVQASVLARQLGYRDAPNMLRHLEDDEKVLVKGYSEMSTHSDQGVWYVTEPGFYKCVGQRNVRLIKDPAIQRAAHAFQRWVFHEVLPQMMRAGLTAEVQSVLAWDWYEVSAQMRQRYGLRMKPNEITKALRSAGWLQSKGCTPKQKYFDYFWHTGTAFYLMPFALAQMVAAIVDTLRAHGDPRAEQYQLEFFSALGLTEPDAA
ncbi:BRO-N domain-containing protein [Nocardia asiatica]|uniref:BRO-N domain-containing protein n=1 Tax=Nocardia asiatica TaxID=209252 RepID=UPI0024562B95|nr:Bro-N domain-containing protein [Nocardia asiatica]